MHFIIHLYEMYFLQKDREAGGDNVKKQRFKRKGTFIGH